MAQNNLIRSTAKIFGGSAIAGMGFAFGRDIYSNTKKKKEAQGAILLVFMLGIAIVGTYTAGVWLARNYKRTWSGFWHRLGGIVILVPSFAVLSSVGALFIPGGISASAPPSGKVESDVSNIEVRPAIAVTQSAPPIQSDNDAALIEVRRALPVSNDSETVEISTAPPEALSGSPEVASRISWKIWFIRNECV